VSLTKVEIRPVVGSPLEINTTDGSGNHLFPLSQFDIVTAIDQQTNAKKMALPGAWPTYHYPDAMTINAQGRILGIGANDTARAISYIAQRLAMLDALLPPLTLLTSRKHAVLRVRMDGMTEDADADVVCIQQAVPLAALFPAQSEFMVTWKGFEPYFVGLSTQTKYILG
jgi:hypothetical protein